MKIKSLITFTLCLLYFAPLTVKSSEVPAPLASESLLMKMREKRLENLAKLSQEELLKRLEQETASKTEDLEYKVIYDYFEVAARHLNKEFNADFLSKTLKIYPSFLKKEPNHLYVEMLVDLYQNKTVEFEKTVNSSLSKDDAKLFMDFLKAALTEATEGNG